MGCFIADAKLAERLGAAGHERVREHYLSIGALERWAELVALLLGAAETDGSGLRPPRRHSEERDVRR